MSSSPPVLVWFRRDLRLADNPALDAAARAGRPVVPVFIRDDGAAAGRRPGAASRWWLHHSLAALQADLAALGARLILRRGDPAAVLGDLVGETGAGAVYWNRCYDGAAVVRDRGVERTLKDRGLAVESFNGALLCEPWAVRTKAGGWYKVYSRFRAACRALGDPPPPLPGPTALVAPAAWPRGDALADWRLTPDAPDWAAGFPGRWRPGSAGGLARLDDFLGRAVGDYAAARDFPARSATSGLSPHLAWGDIGPRQVWHATVTGAPPGEGRESFLGELLWREFAYHVLFHFPDLAEVPMAGRFAAFPWRPDDDLLRAWQRGRTGYPIVDAGMRELWATGTMHNRVRMVAGSFLVKHLLQPWQAGEAWFWDTLVDADVAANPFNWQWVAGCGADAAPYVRVFNPTLQGEKFDAAGTYVRRWVPEVAGLPDRYVHKPWAAPAADRAAAGVRLGETYPVPVVDHAAARDRALAAFKAVKNG